MRDVLSSMPSGAVICLVVSGWLGLGCLWKLLLGKLEEQSIRQMLVLGLVQFMGGMAIVLLDVFAPEFLGSSRGDGSYYLPSQYRANFVNDAPQFYQGSQYWLGTGIVIMAVGAFFLVMSRVKR